MIYNQTGQSCEYKGQKYEVGGVVYANPTSQCYGLVGCIEEIRTGTDKNGNTFEPEICCDFCEPNGAVITRLLDEDGEELVYSKDESNRGCFEDDMLPYLKSDKQLKEAIQNGRLVFINNNWIEYDGYVLNKETGKKQFIDLGMTADNIVDDDILEAINQVLDRLDQVVLEIKSIAGTELSRK